MVDNRLRDWLRTGADITVVVGILLVVIQIRQNTNAVIGANSTAVTDESLLFFQAGLDNQITARAIQKVADKEDLTTLERSQYARLQYLNFRGFENAFLQYKRGHYPQAEWERYRAIIKRILADDPIARDELDQLRGWGFTPEFERELESIMTRR
jgi:hypothetical protein